MLPLLPTEHQSSWNIEIRIRFPNPVQLIFSKLTHYSAMNVNFKCISILFIIVICKFTLALGPMLNLFKGMAIELSQLLTYWGVAGAGAAW